MFDILEGINFVALRWCYEWMGVKLFSRNYDFPVKWRNMWSIAGIWDESHSSWWLSLLMASSCSMERVLTTMTSSQRGRTSTSEMEFGVQIILMNWWCILEEAGCFSAGARKKMSSIAPGVIGCRSRECRTGQGAGGWRTPRGLRADQFMGCLVSNLVVTCACCSCFGLYSQKHLGTQIQLISAGVLLLNTF